MIACKFEACEIGWIWIRTDNFHGINFQRCEWNLTFEKNLLKFLTKRKRLLSIGTFDVCLDEAVISNEQNIVRCVKIIFLMYEY